MFLIVRKHVPRGKQNVPFSTLRKHFIIRRLCKKECPSIRMPTVLYGGRRHFGFQSHPVLVVEKLCCHGELLNSTFCTVIFSEPSGHSIRIFFSLAFNKVEPETKRITHGRSDAEVSFASLAKAPIIIAPTNSPLKNFNIAHSPYGAGCNVAMSATPPMVSASVAATTVAMPAVGLDVITGDGAVLVRNRPPS